MCTDHSEAIKVQPNSTILENIILYLLSPTVVD